MELVDFVSIEGIEPNVALFPQGRFQSQGVGRIAFIAPELLWAGKDDGRNEIITGWTDSPARPDSLSNKP